MGCNKSTLASSSGGPGAGGISANVHDDWIELKGPSLEPLLAVAKGYTSSPARLVDARFLLELAGFDRVDGYWWEKVKGCGRMVRRQDLPDRAFLNLDQVQNVKRIAFGTGSLRILVVSYPWHQPDNPDPQGFSLGIICYALASFMNLLVDDGIMGVFIDFMSLMQKDPAGERTPEEKKLFDQALESLAEIYSHLHTITFKITCLPEDYPQGFAFPKGCTPNTANYHSRGWCYCESSVASLAKNGLFVLDLGNLTHDVTMKGKPADMKDDIGLKCIAGRAAPMLPAEFESALEQKAFTSKKADLPTVGKIYRDAFAARLGEAKMLHFQELSWGDSEAESLARVLASGAAPLLEQLAVRRNEIGDKGAAALAGALSSEVTPQLRIVDLSYNKIGEEGVRAWAAAIDAGAAPNLVEVYVFDNSGGDSLVKEALGRRRALR